MWAANPVHAYEHHKRDDGFEADYAGRELAIAIATFLL